MAMVGRLPSGSPMSPTRIVPSLATAKSCGSSGLAPVYVLAVALQAASNV